MYTPALARRCSRFVLLLGCCLIATKLCAQRTQAGRPLGLGWAPPAAELRLGLPDGFAPEPPRRQGLYPIARTLPVPQDRRDFLSAAQDTVIGGRRVWRLRLALPGAKGATFSFDAFEVPPGGRFYVYTPDGSTLKGAYGDWNEHGSPAFAIGPTRGKELILEYNLPKAAPAPGTIRLGGVGYVYRSPGAWPASTTGGAAPSRRDGFGDAENCHVNVNCSEGNRYQQADRAVVRILVKKGFTEGFCTGAMVNNTAEDGKLYLLSAEHCALKPDGEPASQFRMDQWVFYFNYAAGGCGDPGSEDQVPDQSLTGGELIARSDDGGGETGSDFLLMELYGSMPDSYNAYLAGWDRADETTYGGVSIHHPKGDIKKISTFSGPTASTSFGDSVANTHWGVVWKATANGHGVTASGSSGSPLLNSQQQVIGVLTGGQSFCDQPDQPDFYGKFSYSWTSNGDAPERRLRDWLDPAGTGARQHPGLSLGIAAERADAQAAEGGGLRVFPNPARTTLQLQLTNPQPAARAGYRLTLTDAQGRRVLQRRLPGRADGRYRLALPSLAAGLYNLRLRSTAGGPSFQRKVMLR